MSNTEMISRWRKTGLLDGLTESEELLIAKHLQDATRFLIDKADNGQQSNVEKISGFMLPIIVRLGRDRRIFYVNIEQLYNDLLNRFSNFVGDEGEACCKFVEEF